MKQRTILFIFIFISILLVSNCQRKAIPAKKSAVEESIPGVGQASPEIEFSDCLNKNITKDFFKGKTIILEFWATWCAPCIAGFPHFNDLSEAFSSDEVVFASITKEHDTNKVKTFLKEKPLFAYNLIDKDGKTNQNFGVSGIPQTVVIGENGTLLWSGYYSQLTQKLLKKIISSQQPIEGKNNASKIQNVAKEKKEILSDFQLEVSLSKDQSPIDFGKMLSMNPGDSKGYYSWTASTWSFLNFVGLQLNRIPKTRIKSNKTDFNINLKYFCKIKKHDNPGMILMNSLATVYNFSYSRKKEIKDCWELGIADNKKLEKYLNPSRKKSWVKGDDSYIFIAQPLSTVSKQLEFFQQEIVEVAEGVEGTYNIEFPKTNWNEIQTFLKEKYGLSLVRKKKEIEILDIVFK